MDSMRSLDTSLPGTSPPKATSESPEHLLQAFKAAALSVTNLFKTATQQGDHGRREGYQEALEDLLAFLDRSNLGLGDGEGWRVRQWVTAKLEGTELDEQQKAESEDESSDKRAQSISPSPEAVSSVVEPTISTQGPQISIQRTVSASSVSIPTIRVPTSSFSFQASPMLPSSPIDSDLDLPDHDLQEPSHPSFRVNLVPRSSRNLGRHINHGRITRSNVSSSSISNGKRRFPFSEFFDIGSLGGKDGSPGPGSSSKRGRFT